jgi:hypothetical protein
MRFLVLGAVLVLIGLYFLVVVFWLLPRCISGVLFPLGISRITSMGFHGDNVYDFLIISLLHEEISSTTH